MPGSTIAPFPHRYSVALELDHLVASPRAPIRAGVPPQFGGSDEVWSPEELLVGAVLLCVKTTFDAFARRAGLPIHAWRGTATGVLDKGLAGPVFSSIRVEVDVETALGSEARVRELFPAVERACIIARALKAPVELVAEVRGRADAG